MTDQKYCRDQKEGEPGMRKRIISISGSIIFIIMIGITGCNTAKATSNPTPEQVYSDDNNVDMFIYEDIVYINAADVDWVKNETFDKGDRIGEISESGITSDFNNWDATVLPVGTEIYESDNAQILLANSGEQLIPYLKWVEG